MAEPVRPRPPEEPREITGIERREREAGAVRREAAGPVVSPAVVEGPDLVRWGPILAGLVSTFASLMLLSLLGLAIGLGGVQPGAPPTAAEAVTPSAIWTAIVLLVSFFIGGYVASRTAGITGSFVAAVNGAMVWATFLTVLLILAAIGAAGVLGPGAPPAPGVTVTPGVVAQVTGALWGSFIVLLLGLGAAILGGMVGRHVAPEPEEYYAGAQR